MAQTHPVALPSDRDFTLADQVSGKTKKRFCVIVLGMHRSGTSALARTLNMLGCDLPKTVLPANKNNEKGYWESGPVVALNNELLSSAGSTWQDLRAVDPGWFASPKSEEFRQKAHQLLNEEFGGSHLFVLKDPRICRLAPFWLDVLESSGVSPYIILPIRHPKEVMASSSQMKGLEPVFVSLIWLHHVLEAEYFSRGKPRCFTSYDRLLGDWKKVAAKASQSFGFSWPSLTAKSAEISTFLSENSRHHSEEKQAFIEDPSVAIWIRETYRIMDSWAESGENAEDFSALDRFRTEFNAVTPAFMAMYAAGDKSTKRERRLKMQLEETTATFEQQRKDLEMKTSLLESVEKTFEESRHALEESETALSGLQARLQENEEALSRVQSEVEKYRESNSETLHKFEQARNSLTEQGVEFAWVKKELETQRTELTQARKEIENSRILEGEAQRNAADLVTRLRQHEDALILTTRELEEYRVRDSEARRKFEEARNSLAEQSVELAWVKKELEVQRAELTQARQETESSRIRESDAQRTATDLDARLRQSEDTLLRTQREVEEYRERDSEARRKLEESRNSIAEQNMELAWLKKELEVQRSEVTQARLETENSRIRESEAQRSAAELSALLRQNEEALIRTHREMAESRERDSEARLKFEEARHSLVEQGVEIAWLKKELEVQRAELMQARQEAGNSRIRESEAHRYAADLEARLQQNAEALLRTHREMEEYREREIEARGKFEEAHNSLAQQELEHIWVKKEFEAQRADLRTRLADSESALAQYRSEAEKLVGLLVTLEQEKRIAEKTTATLKERIEVLTADEVHAKVQQQACIAELRAQKEQLDAELARIRLEMTKVRKQLSREKAQREWMHKTTPLLVNTGSSWTSKLLNLAPAMLSYARQMKRLQREGLFDGAEYLSANPDVAEAGVDPLYHYLRHGMLENRQLSQIKPDTTNKKGPKK